MKKLILISLAIAIAISVSIVTFAFAGEEKDKTVTKIKVSDGHVMTVDEDGEVWISEGEEGKVKVVKKGAKGAFLGVYMEDLSKELIEDYDYPHKEGVLLSGIIEDSPADKAGLEEDDIIYSIDGELVEDSKQLGKLIQSREPGDKVEIVFYRDGTKKTVEAELDDNEFQVYTYDYDDMAKEYAKAAKAFTWTATPEHFASTYALMGESKGRLGVKLHSLNEDLAGYFSLKDDKGALVLEVVEESPAEEVGIKAGDVIVAVGGDDVSDAGDVKALLIDVEEDEKVEIVVMRKGKKKTFMVELEEDEYSKAFLYAPKVHMEIPEIPKYKISELQKMEIEKEALEKELQVIEKRLEKIEKRLKDIEKE
jgi:serine protease Do